MAFKMKGSSFLKDVKMYEGDGNVITIDDSNLGEVYTDENGNKARDYTYTTKDGKEGVDVLYLKPPRGPSKWENKKPPRRKRIMPDFKNWYGEDPNQGLT